MAPTQWQTSTGAQKHLMRSLLLLILISLGACATKPHGEVEYYTGVTIIRAPQSKKILAKIPVLMRRTVDPYAKKMLEEIIQLQSRNKKNETLISFEFIQGNHFAIQDEARLIRGHAYFHGPDWKWTHWTVHFSQIDGSVVKGEIRRTTEGLIGTKTLTNTRGGVLELHEELREIDLPTFKKLKKNKTR